MDEELDQPTEEISLDKDQADCLLICLTQQLNAIDYRLKHKDEIELITRQSLQDEGFNEEQIIKALAEARALDISLKETIPGLLGEIKEIYPALQERSKPESRIIVPPSWKKP